MNRRALIGILVRAILGLAILTPLALASTKLHAAEYQIRVLDSLPKGLASFHGAGSIFEPRIPSLFGPLTVVWCRKDCC